MFESLHSSNSSGVPYLRTRNVAVSTEAVTFSLGFRRIPLVGYLTINISDVIPEGTTATLPVQFTLNGFTRNLTFFGGANVTAGDLTETGIITVFHDWFSGTLQLVSALAPASA